jgi:hypothetical protein
VLAGRHAHAGRRGVRVGLARANIATRSILGRKIGTWARRYTTAATATAQPQSQNATQRDQTDKERGSEAAPKGTKYQPKLRPGAACHPVRTLRHPPKRAAPPQRHGRHRMSHARTGAAPPPQRCDSLLMQSEFPTETARGVHVPVCILTPALRRLRAGVRISTLRYAYVRYIVALHVRRCEHDWLATCAQRCSEGPGGTLWCQPPVDFSSCSSTVSVGRLAQYSRQRSHCDRCRGRYGTVGNWVLGSGDTGAHE